MENFKTSADVLFILLGAIMILAMHAGFAFLELGTVRKKNQINALVKILCDFSVSTLAYFFIGYGIAYGVNFLAGAETLVQKSGYELTKFFFLLTFAAAIPAIVSGGIAERARFGPQLAATFLLVGFVYPFFEGIAWNQAFGIQAALKASFGEEFHDFAGSVVVHAVGGWIGLAAVILLGARRGRYHKDGGISAHPPSSIPFLALGAWILIVGWFGFNAGSALEANGTAALAFVNTWLATAMAATSWMLAEWMVKGKPSMLGAASGAVSGLVAITPAAGFVGVIGALAIGLAAGVICLWGVNGLKKLLGADDSLDVFGVHGVGGILGALLTGVFAAPSLGGTGIYDYVANKVADNYDIMGQVVIQATAVGVTLVWSGTVAFVCYKIVDIVVGLRVAEDEEREGLDITSHGESAYHN